MRPLQIATIFSNIEYILSVNEELAFALDMMRNTPACDQMIGSEFIRLVSLIIFFL